MMGLDFFRGMSSNMATGNGTTQSEEVSSWVKNVFICLYCYLVGGFNPSEKY